MVSNNLRIDHSQQFPWKLHSSTKLSPGIPGPDKFPQIIYKVWIFLKLSQSGITKIDHRQQFPWKLHSSTKLSPGIPGQYYELFEASWWRANRSVVHSSDFQTTFLVWLSWVMLNFSLQIISYTYHSIHTPSKMHLLIKRLRKEKLAGCCGKLVLLVSFGRVLARNEPLFTKSVPSGSTITLNCNLGAIYCSFLITFI